MSNLQVFNYANKEVRTVHKDNGVWWVLKDVCGVLNIENHKDLPKRLDDDEVGRFDLPHPQNADKSIEMLCVNESGLYNVILRSDKPQAKDFKRWVTHEVLPSIRQHGAYMTPETIERVLLNPDTIISIATQLKASQERVWALETAREEDKPKVLFADSVSASNTSILVGDLAKLLKQNGVDTGQKRLFAWLRSNGYLIKQYGTSYNMPTQRAMEMQLFEVKETSITHADGHISISRTVKVTGKGQLYFINLIMNQTA